MCQGLTFPVAPSSKGPKAMEQRLLGRTGASVSVVGLGTWQLGGDWGAVS